VEHGKQAVRPVSSQSFARPKPLAQDVQPEVGLDWEQFKLEKLAQVPSAMK